MGLSKKILDAVKKNGRVRRRTHLRKDQNRPGKFEQRSERSHGGAGRAGGGMGMDSASSAQSKRVGRGETACLWSSLGELGQTGSEGGTGGGQGGIDGVISDVGGVWDAGGSETACFWGS